MKRTLSKTPMWLTLLALPLIGFTPQSADAAPSQMPYKTTGLTPKQLKVLQAKQAKTRRARPKNFLPKEYQNPCKGLGALSRRPGKAPFAIGEELGYEITVAGAYVGRMETKVGKPRKVNGKMHLPLFARARTNSFVAAFQPFEGRYMSMVSPDELSTTGLRTELTYGDDPRWEKVRFSPDGHEVTADFLLRGREHKRTYGADHDMTDILTLLYLARVVKVDGNTKACQDVFGARRLWRMTAEVIGSQKISTPGGKLDAWKVKTVFDRKPTPGLSTTKRPRFEMEMFIAKDDSQIPLQFVVKTEGIVAKGVLKRWATKGSDNDASWAL